MELLIENLKGIIKHFGVPVLILGQVWGTAAAHGLAIAYPELVSRLIIMMGVNLIPFQRDLCEDEAQNVASQYIPCLRREGSEIVLAENDFERLEAMFRQSMDITWLSGVRLDRYKLAWKDADRVGAMVDWYRATRLWVPKPKDVPQKMPEVHFNAMRISMPHLVLWGRNDTIMLPQSYTGLTDLCDDVTIIEFTNADHWLHHQVPKELSKAIMTWLDH